MPIEAETNPAETNIEDVVEETGSTEQQAQTSFLGGKYASQEEFEKAFMEMEAKLQASSNPKPEETEPVVKEETEPKPETKATVTSTDVENQINDMVSYYREHKEISEDLYTKAEKEYNIPRSMVDQYIQYSSHYIATKEAEIVSEFGGEDEVQSILEYAYENSSPAMRKELETSLNNADVEKTKLMLSAYRSQMGGSPLLKGDTVKGGTISAKGTYSSLLEYGQDLQKVSKSGDEKKINIVMEKARRSGLIS